jgi:predicted phosphodiesterase
MRLQLLSDLHLETESYEPQPAPGAELLVLAGDVDSTWREFARFKDWPVPVIVVAGNHEFDRRELDDARAALRVHCEGLGLTLLERERVVLTDASGRRIRIVGTTRWSDFDLHGHEERERAMRAATYFVDVMRSTLHGQPFDAHAVRDEALACRAWLATELMSASGDDLHWDATVVITHYGPSARSADGRYGRQPGTASFCNADDDLLPFADLWLHGHLHCRHDYQVAHARGATRVVCNARGHSRKGEANHYDGKLCLQV